MAGAAGGEEEGRRGGPESIINGFDSQAIYIYSSQQLGSHGDGFCGNLGRDMKVETFLCLFTPSVSCLAL